MGQCVGKVSEFHLKDGFKGKRVQSLERMASRDEEESHSGNIILTGENQADSMGGFWIAEGIDSDSEGSYVSSAAEFFDDDSPYDIARLQDQDAVDDVIGTMKNMHCLTGSRRDHSMHARETPFSPMESGLDAIKKAVFLSIWHLNQGISEKSIPMDVLENAILIFPQRYRDLLAESQRKGTATKAVTKEERFIEKCNITKEFYEYLHEREEHGAVIWIVSWDQLSKKMVNLNLNPLILDEEWWLNRERPCKYVHRGNGVESIVNALIDDTFSHQTLKEIIWSANSNSLVPMTAFTMDEWTRSRSRSRSRTFDIDGGGSHRELIALNDLSDKEEFGRIEWHSSREIESSLSSPSDSFR